MLVWYDYGNSNTITNYSFFLSKFSYDYCISIPYFAPPSAKTEHSAHAETGYSAKSVGLFRPMSSYVTELLHALRSEHANVKDVVQNLEYDLTVKWEAQRDDELSLEMAALRQRGADTGEVTLTGESVVEQERKQAERIEHSIGSKYLLECMEERAKRKVAEEDVARLKNEVERL